jgi:hypothetical protein
MQKISETLVLLLVSQCESLQIKSICFNDRACSKSVSELVLCASVFSDRQINEALHRSSQELSAQRLKVAMAVADESLIQPAAADAIDSQFCTPRSYAYTTPRGEGTAEGCSSGQTTPGDTNTLSSASRRRPDAHAENRRLQREIEGMRERLRGMGMCGGPAIIIGRGLGAAGPHPTPQEHSAVGSAAASPVKPTMAFRRASESSGKPASRPAGDLLPSTAAAPTLNTKPVGCDSAADISSATVINTVTKLRPMPAKPSGKENLVGRPKVDVEGGAAAGIPAPAALGSGLEKPAGGNAVGAGGPSLFAVMRTAATVKAAERADGSASTGASAVYQATAAVLSATPSAGAGRSLQEERERLKAKVTKFVLAYLYDVLVFGRSKRCGGPFAMWIYVVLRLSRFK